MTVQRRIIFSTSLLILAGVLVLGIGEWQAQSKEAASNMIYPMDAPGLKFEFRPGGTENAYGYNERELSIEKPPGMRRVAVLGDSVTHGGEVPMGQTYSHIAENTLHAMGLTDYQVLNFAVYGYDIESIEALARYRVPAWKPDLVVYGFYTNDVIATELTTVSGYPTWVGTGARPFAVLSRSLDPTLHQYSALFRKIEGAAAARALANTSQKPQWEWFEQHFAGLIEACRELSAPLVVYLLPPHVFVQPSMEACNKAAGVKMSFCENNLKALNGVLELATKYGIPALDGGAAYRTGPVVDLHRIEDDPHHPNEEGHRRLGVYLGKAIAGMQ
jgi:lysophospholipase L1-like esterase